MQMYLVTYDIRHAKRLRKVHKTMKGFGDPLQYSVFRCEFSEANRVRMVSALSEVINHDEDQVLIFNLGPVDGIRADMVESLGQKYSPADHDAMIV